MLGKSKNNNSNKNEIDILYIYRKPQVVYFSLEKIFNQLARQISRYRKVTQFSVPYARLSLLTIIGNCLVTRRQRARVFHVTGDVHYIVLLLPKQRTILTIHDLALMYSKKGFKRFLFKYLYLIWPVKHCRFITCISEKTKEDIIRFTGCDPNIIKVIPNPVDDCFSYNEKESSQNRPVILFVGTAAHKNLERSIEAIRGIDCHLEIIGIVPEELKERMRGYGVLFNESYGLSHKEVAEKYTNCDILLFPSLFEGFGLPIIEAQQVGRAVITSRRSPMLEVAGNGAVLVDPENVESIRDALLLLIRDGDYRKRVVSNGRKNVERFSVNRIAEQYNLLYEEILAD